MCKALGSILSTKKKKGKKMKEKERKRGKEGKGKGRERRGGRGGEGREESSKRHKNTKCQWLMPVILAVGRLTLGELQVETTLAKSSRDSHL
jgi:hypothetical protein